MSLKIKDVAKLHANNSGIGLMYLSDGFIADTYAAPLTEMSAGLLTPED